MSYSVQDLENDLSGILHGPTNNQIQNLDGVINRAARTLLLDIDPQETIRDTQFVNPIFNTIFDYPIAADVKGTGLLDIYPQVRRLPRDTWTQAYDQAFDVTKNNVFAQANMFNINFNSSLKTIRINAPFLNPPIIVNQIESITSNGTWAVGGTASSLTVNNTNYVNGAGSLQFNVTAGAATLANSTMSAVNLSNVAYQSSMFVWVYIPTGSSLTSVNLRWGSSSSNYYTSTVTQNQDAVAFVNGWNLCQFVWDNSTTTVGTPVNTAINYSQITLNVTASMTGCLVNSLDCIMGTILNYSYYSKYMFRDAITGAYQEKVTDPSNLINLDTESYNLLFNLVAFLATQQQQGLDASFYDGNFFGQEYQKGVTRYKALYKSQRQKPQSIYYSEPNVSNSRFIGRGFYN